MFPVKYAISNLLLLSIIVQFCTEFTFGYKPVVIIHGLLASKTSLNNLRARIAEKHPGTDVTIIDRLHGVKSMAPMWFQVKKFKNVLENIMENNPGGINMIGFSQGGLVARGVIETTRKHNVHTFISLSSPQGGQYGNDFLRIFFPRLLKHSAWLFFYTLPGQLNSIGNYWRDPHHIHLYFRASRFLPRLNNEVGHRFGRKFKRNFLKLQRLVLIGGPDDGVISPWQSSQFGIFDEYEQVMPMRNTRMYKDDTFGLKTLDKLGKLVNITVSGVGHHYWHKNLTVVDNYILPHLD